MTTQAQTRTRATDVSRRRLPRASVLVPSVAVVSCQRDDDTLLLDMAAGARITLDRFGSRVWSALTDRPTLATLLTRLREEGIPAQRLAEDVTQLLARWRAGGVIDWR